eukprot:COSAG05_NODE_631_length_8203_cov_23.575148_4_plen_74_part_00
MVKEAIAVHLVQERYLHTGACPDNRPCAQQYVGKYQSCMVIEGRLIVHAPVDSGYVWRNQIIRSVLETHAHAR